MRLRALAVLGFWTAISVHAAPVKVRMDFVEALAPRDTTSSARFQAEFEAAISTAKRLLAPKLSGCGYELETTTAFYDASDPLQAKERGLQAAAASSWIIVGPRRSNHYLLLAQGAVQVPTISLMASASEVSTLGRLHLSFSPLNAQMAAVAAEEARLRLPKGRSPRTFVTIVSQDCVSCVDFADQFERLAESKRLKRAARIEVLGDAPEATPIALKLRELKPSFVLLPNYSKVSRHLMAELQEAIGSAFFVGGDGWGDSTFGFVQSGKGIGAVRGFTVRGFPPVDRGLSEFQLGRTVLRDLPKDQQPQSGPSLAILRSLEATTELLCRAIPKQPSEFRAAFEKHGKSLYSAPWGVSIFDLSNGELRFSKSRKGF